jgi:hypothetical protein
MMERIVRRSELRCDDEGSNLSSEQDLPPTSTRSQSAFEFIKHDIRLDDVNHQGPNAADDEEELEFCLFAPSADISRPEEKSKPVAKIRLQSPEAQDATPGFTQAQRDQSYYLTQTPTAEKQQDFEISAFTGDQIIAQSKIPWTGSAYAWRVTRLSCTRKQRLALAEPNSVYEKLLGAAVPATRKRKGKAARIKVRKQIADRKAKEEQKRKVAEENDAMDREKRTRRNREKKVKKKLREKAKKQSSTGEAAQESDVSD